MANTIGTAYINIAPNMQGIQGKIAGGLRGSGSAFGNQFGSEISGKSAVIIGALAGVAQVGITKAMNIVTSSISNAVARVDTLNAAQKTFQYMGFSATDAAKATKDVTASIFGLPTPLDGAVRGMTSLAATYGDVKLGQKVFSALNDGILGFGGSAAMVDGAIQQLSQLPLDGPLDAQTWNSLRNSGLTPVLVAMGKDMGLSVGQLKEKLGSGELTVRDFTNELIKLDTQGGGGLENLHKIALTATSGIGTGFANMQTAISRGLANIIQAVGQQNISSAIAGIGKVFEQALNGIAKAVPVVIGYIKDFVGLIRDNSTAFGLLASAALGVAGAMAALFIVSKVAAAFSAIQKAIQGAQIAMATYTALTGSGTGAMVAFNAVTALNPIGLIVIALAAAAAAMAYFFTKTETGKKVFRQLSDTVKPVINFVGTQLKSAFESLVSIGKQVATALQPVIDTIKGILANKTVQTVLKGIGIALLAITAAPVIAFFATMIASITILSKVLGFIADHFKIFKVVALAALAPLIAPIALLVAAIKIIPGVVSAVAAAIGTAFSAISAAYNATLGPVFGVMKTVIMGIFRVYVAVWAFIGAVVLGTMFMIAGVIGNVMQAIWGVITTVWNAIYGVISAVVGFIAGRIINAWNFYYGIISSVLGAIWRVITSIWNSISGFLGAIFGRIRSIAAGAWNAVYGTIAGAVSRIWGAVTGTFNSVIGFLGGIAGRIIRVFAGAGGWLYNAGRNIIQGLINGVGSLIGRVASFMVDKLPSAIRGPFKRAMGISSPSKVFAEYGSNITQGLISGISKNTANVTNAVKNMSSAAINGMADGNLATPATISVPSAGAYSPGGQGGNTTHQDVTIGQIVLGDQSAVKEFFKQLNQDTLNVGMGLTPNQGAV